MATLILPSKLKPYSPAEEADPFCIMRRANRRTKRNQSMVPVARLFGPAIFEASKLRVLFVGVDGKKHPGKLPRTYTLTHSDITSKITLAVSQTINNSQTASLRIGVEYLKRKLHKLLYYSTDFDWLVASLQGWYNKLQRDEVVAEWKKIRGRMSLHVHCHISGGHFLLDLIANLRYYIFCKELPVVLKAFVHGDWDMFESYPELQEAKVWVYFHSNLPEFNKVECWGPLYQAVDRTLGAGAHDTSGERPREEDDAVETPKPCPEDCSCCFPAMSSIPWPQNLASGMDGSEGA